MGGLAAAFAVKDEPSSERMTQDEYAAMDMCLYHQHPGGEKCKKAEEPKDAEEED